MVIPEYTTSCTFGSRTCNLFRKRGYYRGLRIFDSPADRNAGYFHKSLHPNWSGHLVYSAAAGPRQCNVLRQRTLR